MSFAARRMESWPERYWTEKDSSAGLPPPVMRLPEKAASSSAPAAPHPRSPLPSPSGCRSLRILNRTTAKAEALALRLRQAFPTLDIGATLPSDGIVDIAINATSLGMKTGDALPMSEPLVQRAGLVAECVVAPEITPLLELARRNGRAIHTGVPMLGAQMDMMLEFMGALGHPTVKT